MLNRDRLMLAAYASRSSPQDLADDIEWLMAIIVEIFAPIALAIASLIAVAWGVNPFANGCYDCPGPPNGERVLAGLGGTSTFLVIAWLRHRRRERSRGRSGVERHPHLGTMVPFHQGLLGRVLLVLLVGTIVVSAVGDHRTRRPDPCQEGALYTANGVIAEDAQGFPRSC